MKVLETYFNNRKSAVNRILETAPEFYTVENFHELRVELKKIKALFEMVAFCSKTFKLKKNFAPFKIIFKKAGIVREIQVDQAILEQQPNFHLIQSYSCRLKKREAKERKDFFSITNKRFIKKLQQKYPIIIRFLKKTRAKKANRYLNKITKEKKKIISKNAFKKQQIHAFRKRIKVHQYNTKIFDLNQQSKQVPEKITLSDMLGEWHDCIVVIALLKKAIKSKKTISRETKQLVAIKKLILLKSDLLFNKINGTLPYHTLL